jgi:hypothetical protein
MEGLQHNGFAYPIAAFNDAQTVWVASGYEDF